MHVDYGYSACYPVYVYSYDYVQILWVHSLFLALKGRLFCHPELKFFLVRIGDIPCITLGIHNHFRVYFKCTRNLGIAKALLGG